MNRAQHGYALVVTLWMVMLLSLLGSSYHHSARTEARLASLSRSGAQALASAEAGIWLAIERLVSQGGVSSRSIAPVEFAGRPIAVWIENQAGKLNLNLARTELIENLLRRASLPDDERTALLHAILDWRDVDGDRRDRGAEDADYRRAGYAYGAKDGPFNAVEELRYVHGMTEPVYRRLEPAFTVYGEHSGIDPRVAVREALLAVPGAGAETVDTYLITRERDDAAAGDVLGNEIDRRFLGSSPSQVYRITVTATVDTARRTITAYVELGRDARVPYTLLAWREHTGGGG